MSLSLFVTCPKGLEELLAEELGGLGASSVRMTVAGVHAEGDPDLAYRICLWSRLGNRVLVPLCSAKALDADTLYRISADLPWEEHFGVDARFAIDFSGSSESIQHTHFGALRVKDGIVDRFRSLTGERPTVDRDAPDIRIAASLRRNTLTLSLDIGGGSLHQRGYRLDAREAPLKENLAAALLLRAGWPAIARAGGSLVDPLCGSGTLLAEAGLMARDVAPGLLRRRFGFEHWRGHRPDAWERLVEQARKRREEGARAPLRLFGFDRDGRALDTARGNLQRAGVLDASVLEQRDLASLECPVDAVPGLLLTNPPYGVRLGDEREIEVLHRCLGERLRAHFQGWSAGVFTARPDLGQLIGMRSTRQYSLFNGALPCKLLMFEVSPSHFFRELEPGYVRPLSEGAQMLANRLNKNARKLSAWLKRSGETCYRLYDADLPEYAVAVDVYGEWVHIQEYAPPPTVDLKLADRRLREAVQAVSSVLSVPADRIELKQRRRQRGTEQYARIDRRGEFMEVREGAARLLVNLHDYLDTGLFLDHRPVRRMLHDWAAGKRFLNLFCYTGAATVQAALGGARSSLSVDLSRTYLDWAQRNFDLNRLDRRSHRLEQADCMAWVEGCTERFDLIFLDPPTFSNSKRAANVLDIQRDHPQLVRACMKLLAPGGQLVFSNNFRKFKLDEQLQREFSVEEITQRSFDPDFARDQKLHRCWLIRAAAV